MSAAIDIVDRFAGHHDALQRATSAPEWARGLRDRGLAAFRAQGVPTTRHEDWKYTSLRPLHKRELAGSAARRPADEPVTLPVIDGLTAHRLVFVDGRYEAGLSDIGALPAGIDVQPLAAGLALESSELADALNRAPDLDAHSFAALNTALLEDGVWLRVARGANVETPLHLVFVSRGGDTALATHPRIVLDVGDSASLTLVEHYAGDDDASGLTNALTQVKLAPAARLKHYVLQEQGTAAMHIAGTHVDQARDSHYENHLVNLGGSLVRNDLHVRLAEPGAQTLLNGFYLTSGRQHVDNHTRVDHLAPHTTSEETYRGVLSGRSRAVFNGKAVVHEGAEKIEAMQSNRNLLLSKGAEVDTKPELEIYADDVKCSHGATVGQLDENAFFYLLSRGLDPHTARSLLTFAFADEVIARLGNDPLRRHVERRAATRLPDNDSLLELV